MTLRSTRHRLGSVQLKALAFIREHPNCSTSDIARHMEMRVKPLLPVLLDLVDKQLIGRQLGLGNCNYESTWLAEVVDA